MLGGQQKCLPVGSDVQSGALKHKSFQIRCHAHNRSEVCIRVSQISVTLAVSPKVQIQPHSEMRTCKKDHLYTQIGVGVVFATHQSTNGLLHRLLLVRVCSRTAFLAICASGADLNAGLGRLIVNWITPRILQVIVG